MAGNNITTERTQDLLKINIYRFSQSQKQSSRRMLEELSSSINYTFAVSREQTELYLQKN